MGIMHIFILILAISFWFCYWNKCIHVSCLPTLIFESNICFYLSCSNAHHWGAYCLIGRADIISAHCVKMQGVESDEWSISSIDASQILDAIGPDSYELYYFGQREEKDRVGLLCCGNLSPIFIFSACTIWSLGYEAFVFCQITAGLENFISGIQALHVEFREIHRLDTFCFYFYHWRPGCFITPHDLLIMRRLTFPAAPGGSS